MKSSADVLISVYAGEKAEYFDACLSSIVNQTSLPTRIILLQDGESGDALNAVVAKYQHNHGDLFEVISLPCKPGFVACLNFGLKHCNSEYLFRMDSDDIAVLNRFEKQLEYMQSHPDIGVLSSALYEFELEPGDTNRIKPVAIEHQKIVSQFPWRNPINHPSVCMRTRILKDIGGYPDVPMLEDYCLWVKLLVAGVKFHNLPEPLQYYRFNIGNINRRGGWQNFKNECRIRWYLYRNNQASLIVTLVAMHMQVLLRLAPVTLRKKLWLWSRVKGDGSLNG